MVRWPDLRTLTKRLPRRPPRACARASAALLCGALAGGDAVAGSVLDRIHATRTLRVCLSQSDAGISYRDPRTGQPGGLDVDLAAAFAADLGTQLVMIDTGFDTFTNDLLTDRCDIAMLAIAATPSRRATLRFSKPYLTGGIVGVASRASEVVHTWADIDRPGVRVGIQRGSQVEPRLRETLRHATIVVLDPQRNREDELQSGRIDVLIGGLPYAHRLLENAEWARLVAPPQPLDPLPYAYAVRPGDDAWLHAVDAFITRIQHDGRLAAAARRHHLTEVMLLQ
ncbi:MAG: ABC transporter substrate-binding protein [Burkholderia sp.]